MTSQYIIKCHQHLLNFSLSALLHLPKTPSADDIFGLECLQSSRGSTRCYRAYSGLYGWFRMFADGFMVKSSWEVREWNRTPVCKVNTAWLCACVLSEKHAVEG